VGVTVERQEDGSSYVAEWHQGGTNPGLPSHVNRVSSPVAAKQLALMHGVNIDDDTLVLVADVHAVKELGGVQFSDGKSHSNNSTIDVSAFHDVSRRKVVVFVSDLDSRGTSASSAHGSSSADMSRGCRSPADPPKRILSGGESALAMMAWEVSAVISD